MTASGSEPNMNSYAESRMKGLNHMTSVLLAKYWLKLLPTRILGVGSRMCSIYEEQNTQTIKPWEQDHIRNVL